MVQKEDGVVKKTIDDLLRDHLAVLSSNKTNEDGKRERERERDREREVRLNFLLHLPVQREHDVQESILFMAKQSGNVDPDAFSCI